MLSQIIFIKYWQLTFDICPYNLLLTTSQLLLTGQDQQITCSKQQATENIVAFHAVVSPHTIENLGNDQNIKFDKIYLNEGSGYYYHLGVFIAPKPGFYLFSVTLATDYNANFYADIKKNGETLMSLSGNGESGGYLDQGSGTVVTKLDAEDEVWVAHTAPAAGAIWGNYYSSFTGVLLADLNE